MTTSVPERTPALERRALGFVPVLFQSIVFAGPAVGVGLSLVFLARTPEARHRSQRF
jgi:hypothetical protein